MAETLTAEKREYVLRVAQDYLDEQFQRVNAILSDSTDPNCVEWEEAATLFQHLFRGLATYYLDEAELLDGESQEVMPAFAWNPEISLDGGNHEFILAASSDFSHERIVWAEIPGVRPESPDVVSWQDARRLVDLIGYATDVFQRIQNFLRLDPDPAPEFSDAQKLQAHGFDQRSFRKRRDEES